VCPRIHREVFLINTETMSATMRYALFCGITQRLVVVLYRRFGTTCWYHLRRFRESYMVLVGSWIVTAFFFNVKVGKEVA
jgi:hypothetical protein